MWTVLTVVAVNVLQQSMLGSIVGNLAGLVWNVYYFRYLTTYAVCIMIVFPVIKRTKCSNKKKHMAYNKAKEQQKSKALIALKSPDFRQEIICYLVLMLPFIVAQVMADTTTVVEALFVSVFTLVVCGLFHGALSFLMLLWVYRSWDKGL